MTKTSSDGGIILKEAGDYDNWLTTIEAHLKRKGCWEAVTTPAEGSDSGESPRAVDKSKEEQAFGIIVRYIDTSLYECTRDPATGQSRTAAGLMKEIKNRFFLPGSGSNLISLKMQLWELSMPEDGSSVILIDQVQRLVQKLKTLCNSTTQEEDQIVILLKALPPSFAMLRAQMDVKYAMGESLNFHQACAAVRLFETSPARKDLAAEATAKDSALYGASAKGGNSARKPGNCNNCGKPGHWAAECRGKKKETANTKGACHHCNKPGHFKRNCPELKQRGTPDERVFIAAMPTSFVLDSGATSHIVTDRSSLATATPANTHILGIGGERAQATHEGTLANFPGKALVVPTAQCNIISIKQLTKNGWSATFTDTEAILTDHKGRKVIGTAAGAGADLFRVEGERVYVASAQEQGEADMIMWHHRLGHPGNKRLREACERDPDIDTSNWPKTMPECNTCAQTKTTRAAVTRSTTHTENDSELGKGARLDVDLIGPTETPSHSGCRFAMHIIDRRTRMTWVVLLKTKAEAAQAMANFLDTELGKYGRICEVVHPDRGGEFTGSKFTTVCTERGIRIVYAASATPEHNGLIERQHRTAVESARGLIMTAGLNKKFWGEALHYAARLHNMLPTSGLPDRLSPWEHWTSEAPKLADLRTFGCKTFFLAPGGKFGKQAAIGIYLGPCADTTGGAARVYNTETGRVVVTRDVKIMEGNAGRPAPTEHPTAETIEQRVPARVSFKSKARVDSGSDSEGYASSDSSSDEEEEAEPPFATPAVTPRASPTATRPTFKTSTTDRAAKDKAKAKVLKQLTIDMSDTGRAQEEAATASRDEACHLSFEHVFLAMGDEPLNYEQAITGPQAEQWKASMREELQALDGQEVFKIVRREPGTRCVGVKWAFKVKTDADNNPVRFKSRLVAKGYTQVEGVDYSDISAPVTSKEAVRTAFAMAASKGWVMEQFDVNTAYLYAELEETIFMEAPAALIDLWGHKLSAEELELLVTGQGVLLLKKALYGLKQSGRRWYITFRDFLGKCGLRPSAVEPCLFVGDGLVVPLYVDDSTAMGDTDERLAAFFTELEGRFDIKRLGFPKHFLGWSIEKRADGSIFIHQRGYTERLFKQFGEAKGRAKATPMASGADMIDNNGPAGDNDLYRSIIGSVLFAVIGTRPDASTATSILSRSVQAPTKAHVGAARNLVGYMAATSTLGLLYPAEEELRMEVYCDASFAGGMNGCKSRTGYVVLINGAPVAWRSSLQPLIAHSTAESEYIALSDAARDAVYIKRLIEAMGGTLSGPIIMYEDNQTAMTMAREVTTKRSKHVDIKYHHIRELVELGHIIIKYCRTEEQVADMLTKPLPKEQFTKLRDRIMAN